MLEKYQLEDANKAFEAVNNGSLRFRGVISIA
jgi:D-arabinose 1-dehydrogenase-like Zn-dependent alcohol dehydrogenase